MQEAALPPDEAERLAALIAYEVLDTEPELAFDDLTHLAAQICDTPIALVSFVDAERQWFKAKVGLDACETPRSVAFCSHAIVQPGDVLIIPDARQDMRFSDNPLVTDQPHVIFYAGAPLVTPSGRALGTLCAIDHKPRELDEGQVEALRVLARQTVSQLELRRSCKELRDLTKNLSRSNQHLEQRNNEIRSFYDTLSHELKTPLTSTTEFISLLREGIAGPLNDDQREYLEIAGSGCRQMLVSINDLLDASRLERGKLSLDTQPTDVEQLIRRICGSLRGSARSKGHDLSWDVEPDLPPATVDAVRFQQILGNLLTNAFKFTPDGGRILVRCELDPSDEQQLMIHVRDNGRGIPPEHVERIFDRLYQVKDEDTALGGMGIGLNLCRELVQLHGGGIGVQSEPGRGSTFSFTVPTAGTEHARTQGKEVSTP